MPETAAAPAGAPPFAPLPAFPVSSVVAERLSRNDASWSGPARVENAQQQAQVIRHLMTGGEAACRHAGLPWVPTRGEDVHDVTYGKSPQGDLFYGDMVVGLRPLAPGERILDFGCSTGRVIRNIAATMPGVKAEGCDPREASIRFVRPRIAGVEWFVSNETPPLPDRRADRYDVVFAVSVWSHFREGAALAWFAEMARVIRPGGELIFSTHGPRSVYFYESEKKIMPAAKAEERRAALARGDIHFLRSAQVDLNGDWGVAYIPRRWLEEKLTDWTIRFEGPGMAKRNQDVYVLRRN